MSAHQMLVSFLVVLTTLHLASSTGTFDCRRSGQDCKNAAKCGLDGKCICNETLHGGFDCGTNKENINDTACTPQCENGGTCVFESNVAICKCNEKYSGSACTVKRADIKCFGDRKIIYVNPVDFNGNMFIKGYRNVAACELKEISGATDRTGFKEEWTDGYTITIEDTTSDCGNITTTTNGTTITYKRFVKVEYDRNIMTSLDEQLVAKCEMENTTDRLLPGIMVQSDMTDSSFVNTSTVNVYEPLVFSATSNNSPLGTNPLLVGQEIVFTFNIPQETGYDSVIVDKLQANDNTSQTDQLNIIQERCPEAPSIITSIERDDDKRTVTIKMKVFKFINSDFIRFTGTAKICRSGDTACDELLTCGAETALRGLGRKKRDSGEQMKVQQTIRVTTDPEAAKTTSTQNSNKPGDCPYSTPPEETHCLQKTEIILVLGLMSASVLVLMIACAVLTWKLLRTSPKVVDIHPPEYQSSRSLPRLAPSNF